MTGRSQKFRALLLAEQQDTITLIADLGQNLSVLVTGRQDSNSDDEHDPEGSTLAFERSQTDALLAQSTQRLAEVSAALARIDAGTYGVCIRCGGAIAPARLEARPYAATCIDCAAATS
ncbi:MAG: TraR/DksA C4-type zinc finger protein [Homoserinimonas sp.]